MSNPVTSPVAIGVSTSGLKDSAIMIFGASGDLTARKLIPALFMLQRKEFLPPNVPIIGVARREKTDDSFRAEMKVALSKNIKGGITDGEWETFSKRLFYVASNLEEGADFGPLRDSVEKIERQQGVGGTRVIYMATDPKLFLSAVDALGKADMIPGAESPRKLRIVFEKPFGRDFNSSRQLSQSLSKQLSEDQIYRIDHYLGKETVQNILLFRCGNSIFEPLLNRNHVDHVQITVAESQGMEAGRGGYYDKSGALRDVLQNHVLQLLCLVAMEPPARFEADAIRDEKLKVLKAFSTGGRPISEWAIPGQYTASEINGKPALGYLQEERIAPESNRESYVAMKVLIDNWRWAGVPFYLRTGKRFPERVSEIAIQFKHPPMHLFSTVECEGDMCQFVGAQSNSLVFRIQPNEAILLSVSTKRPGMQYQINPVTMNFQFEDAFGGELPEAYERLLLDVLRGDSTLFTRSDELEEAWKFVTPVLEYWESQQVRPEPYAAGSWGPAKADELLTSTGRNWRKPTAAEMNKKH